MNYEQERVEAGFFFDDCLKILEGKAHDYASNEDVFSNFKKIANVCDVDTEKVFQFFIAVKLARLVELTTKEAVNESKSDSCLDISNYACLYALYIKEKQNEKN